MCISISKLNHNLFEVQLSRGKEPHGSRGSAVVRTVSGKLLGAFFLFITKPHSKVSLLQVIFIDDKKRPGQMSHIGEWFSF